MIFQSEKIQQTIRGETSVNLTFLLQSRRTLASRTCFILYQLFARRNICMTFSIFSSLSGVSYHCHTQHLKESVGPKKSDIENEIGMHRTLPTKDIQYATSLSEFTCWFQLAERSTQACLTLTVNIRVIHRRNPSRVNGPSAGRFQSRLCAVG